MQKRRKLKALKIPPRLRAEFPEPAGNFPEKWGSLRFIGGRTLSRVGGRYQKAVVLVQTQAGIQLRLYGWRLTKKGKWWHEQRFYLPRKHAATLIQVLDQFLMSSTGARSE